MPEPVNRLLATDFGGYKIDVLVLPETLFDLLDIKIPPTDNKSW